MVDFKLCRKSFFFRLLGVRGSSRLNQPTPGLCFLKEPSQFLIPGLSFEIFYECMQGFLKYLTLKLNSTNITADY